MREYAGLQPAFATPLITSLSHVVAREKYSSKDEAQVRSSAGADSASFMQLARTPRFESETAGITVETVAKRLMSHSHGMSSNLPLNLKGLRMTVIPFKLGAPTRSAIDLEVASDKR